MQVEELAGAALEAGLYELLRQRLCEVVVVPTPAAGADWTVTVPSGECWELLSVQSPTLNNATVATRFTSLQVADASGNIANRISAAATTAAGQTGKLRWAAGLGTAITTAELNAPLPTPPVQVLEGWTISSQTINLQAGDQYGPVTLLVRKWSLTKVVQAAEWYGRRELP